MKLFIAVFALAAATAVAQAQSEPKPTKADVENVVQIISADPAKKEAYCQLQGLDQQMMAADQRKDQAAIETLGKQADELSQKVGPEYAKLMQGMDQVNPDEGKQFSALFVQLCKK